MNECDHIPIKLYLPRQAAGQIGLKGHSFLTLVLGHVDKTESEVVSLLIVFSIEAVCQILYECLKKVDKNLKNF